MVFRHPSEKYEFVSWGYYSQCMEKMFQTTKQYKKLGMNEHDSRVSENCEIKVI